jgi:hypothetical protein
MKAQEENKLQILKQRLLFGTVTGYKTQGSLT